jgi:DNA replication protein DnaC
MNSISEHILEVFNRPVRPFNVDDYGGLSDDEYLKGEVIMCKLCKTPRMFIDEAHNIKVRCLCECQAQKRDKSEQDARELERQREIERLQRASLIGERYQKVNFELTETGHNPTFDAAFIRCRKYCEVSSEVLSKGLGIYLYGDKGTGKTHLTACMANALILKRKQVLFTNFAEISKLLRGTFGKRDESEAGHINRLATIDFLFIDDLGTERVQTKDGDLWLQEKIFDVLNKRYNNRKPTIFTSNYSIQELITDRGFAPRTVDRIVEMSSAVLKVEGKSYRLANRVKDLPF